jgi:hypothetical protein
MWTKSSDHLLALNDSIKNDGRNNSEDTQGRPFVLPHGIRVSVYLRLNSFVLKKKKKTERVLLVVEVERYRIVEFSTETNRPKNRTAELEGTEFARKQK